LGLEPTIYHTRGEHVNHYIDAVEAVMKTLTSYIDVNTQLRIIVLYQFVSDLWQVGGFLRFLSPIKLTADITEIVLKVPLHTLTPNPSTIPFY